MKDYQEILAGYREEMIETLTKMISFRSVVSEPAGDLPFGEAVEEVFEYTIEKCREMGFDVFRAGHYGGHAEAGEGEECMGILAHLDVVPEGDGWSSEPFAAEIRNGRLYGRGANDDKGPAVAALYALKALKESGVKFNKRVRLIFGLDEEAGEWRGIEKYFEAAGRPDFGFTPDADFPLVQAEMGILVFEIVKKFRKNQGTGGLRLKSIKGGQAYNMVADKCTAVIMDKNYDHIKNRIEEFSEKTGYEISGRARGRSFEIKTSGIPSHGARPEKGVNAVSVMMMFLKELSFENDDVNDFVEFYNEKIGFTLHGQKIGADFEDEISGKLIWNTGLVNADEESGSFTINVRYPVTGTKETVYEGIMPHLDEYGFGVIKGEHKEGIFIPSDSSLLQTLMEVYRKHTGDYETEPIVTGGGTYARAMKNAVAYGIKFPGEEATEHQKDEYIDIDNMMKGAAIFAEAVYRLCCVE